MQPWEELQESAYRLQLSGDFAQAERLYRQVLTQKPDDPHARLALAQLQMMQTVFREGREWYEARLDVGDEPGRFDWRQLPTPRWRGEPVTGRHIHLWAEQGFGDVIMYAMFLPQLLAQKPSQVTLAMFPKMVSLFARSFPGIAVESLEEAMNYSLSAGLLEAFPQLQALARQSGVPMDLEPMHRDYERMRARGAFDLAAPIGDLLVYGLPGYVPSRHVERCLIADPTRMEETRRKLQSLGPGRRIGISWHTSSRKSGIVRTLPLEQWLPILAVPGYHFVSLHHHMDPLPIERFCAEHDCTIVSDPKFDPIQDTEGLAALVACMDEVISIDNSNAHLAGALGIPTTLLLPRGCDFRWPVLPGPDTLWYQSVRVLRQDTAMDWQPVIRQVVEKLKG